MLQEISKEGDLRIRRERFSKITEGSLFDLSRLKYFIATERPRGDTVQAIELNSANRARIIAGKRHETTTLRFDDMLGLNVVDDENNLRYWTLLLQELHQPRKDN